MKIHALVIALMLSAVGYSQLPPASEDMGAPLAYAFTADNVRPVKVADFTTRAAEFNKRQIALIEEGKQIDEVRSSEKYKDSHLFVMVTSRNRKGFKFVRKGPEPPSIKDYKDRVQRWKEEQRDFLHEIGKEFNLRRAELATAEKMEIRRKILQTPAFPLAEPIPAPAQPVAEPKPSSVPGFPAGVEPATKTEESKVLPPGMTRR